VWVPEGQNRGGGIPSLNINVDKEAEDPAMVGGAAAQGADPVPWAAWQEQDGNVNGAGNHPQIFVSKGVKQAAGGQPCAGFKPSANASVGAFCWQQVGLDRLAKAGGASPAGDPTLNIDPSRNGIEPDDAFTGPADTVAWVVWYETGPSAIGLRANEQVFAAKIVADPAADGGFHWQAVGNGTATQTNVLDTSGPSQFGACAASVPAADACSLNTAPAQDAEDRRVAAGTLTPGSPTVPWVVWAEDTGGGRHAIFVSRLVGGTHFELFNGGNPLSNPANDATCPGGAPNAPFATFTRAGAPQALFAQAVGPCVVILGCQGAGTASQGQVFVRAARAARAGRHPRPAHRPPAPRARAHRADAPARRARALRRARQGRAAGAVETARQRPPPSPRARSRHAPRVQRERPAARRRPRAAGGGADRALRPSDLAPG